MKCSKKLWKVLVFQCFFAFLLRVLIFSMKNAKIIEKWWEYIIFLKILIFIDFLFFLEPGFLPPDLKIPKKSKNQWKPKENQCFRSKIIENLKKINRKCRKPEENQQKVQKDNKNIKCYEKWCMNWLHLQFIDSC